MFKSLKTQLMVSGIAALALLLLGVWLVTRGFYSLAVAVMVVICVYIILLIIWFWRFVADPIDRLTAFASRIAEGSYGSKLENHSDNELGRLTDEINNMSEKVAVAERSRTDFISQVSHELRTPLTAITGWAETIAYDENVQGDSLRGIQIISREAERLTGMEIDYSPSPSEIPLIPGDPERLKQVFLNLLDNAVKHGGDGEKVDVSLRERDDGVHITVRDYGHGIPAGELPHVKEKFYKGSSKNRGTGIGLSVCDEIVTRHGGRLIVENAKDGGCQVTVILPMKSK